MKTISDYAIYCTEEQTKKALKLGAPIETYDPIIIDSKDGGSFTTPTIETVTAEQMIGWIDSQGLLVVVAKNYDDYRWEIWERSCIIDMSETEAISTREEATIAAIDVALDYLSKCR